MLRLISYSLSIIPKNNPRGVNRFEKMDRYIQQHNHPHIKDHLDFQNNLRLLGHKFELVREYAEISEGRVAEKRATSWYPVMFNPITEGNVQGDDQLVEPIEGKTLWGFLKEGLNKKNRKDTHRLAYIVLFWFPLVFFINLYLYMTLEPIDGEQVKSLDPMKPYTYTEAVGKDQLERRRLEVVREAREYSAFLVEKQLSQ